MGEERTQLDCPLLLPGVQAYSSGQEKKSTDACRMSKLGIQSIFFWDPGHLLPDVTMTSCGLADLSCAQVAHPNLIFNFQDMLVFTFKLVASLIIKVTLKKSNFKSTESRVEGHHAPMPPSSAVVTTNTLCQQRSLRSTNTDKSHHSKIIGYARVHSWWYK